MGELSTIKVGRQHSFYFKVYDGAGAAVTGLTNTDFSKNLFKDTTWIDPSGGGSPPFLNVTAVDATHGPGFYRCVFTPNSAGIWFATLDYAGAFALEWDFTVDATVSSIDTIIADLLLTQESGTFESDGRFTTHCLAFVLAMLTNKTKLNTVTNKIEVYGANGSTVIGLFDVVLGTVNPTLQSTPEA